MTGRKAQVPPVADALRQSGRLNLLVVHGSSGADDVGSALGLAAVLCGFGGRADGVCPEALRGGVLSLLGRGRSDGLTWSGGKPPPHDAVVFLDRASVQRADHRMRRRGRSTATQHPWTCAYWAMHFGPCAS